MTYWLVEIERKAEVEMLNKKKFTRTNKAVGTVWRAMSEPPYRRQGPPRPLLLLVETPSVGA